MLQVHQFPCLSDNYGYLLHDPASGETVCIDTPDAEAYLREAETKGWRITAIWNTHWHPDHAGGNAAIKAATGCEIIAPAVDAPKIAGVDRRSKGGDTVQIGEWAAQVIDVGGHTMGHIAYHLPASADRLRRRCAVRAGLRPHVRRHRAAVLGQPFTPQGAAAADDALLRSRIHRRPTPSSRSTPTRTTPPCRPMLPKSTASAQRASRPCRCSSRASWRPIRSCAPIRPKCGRVGEAPRRRKPSPQSGRRRISF